MNWERYLTSPPPSTGWVFDSEMVAIAHRSKTEEIHCAAEELPADALDVGPVGLQAVNDDALGPVLARLKGAAEGTDTAAVIVPTSWLRSFLIEVDRVPRREDELHDIVRWRLKKLLPVPPADLRLSVVRLPEIEGQRRLLVMAGIERAIAAIEACYATIGIEVGLITTRLFALVPRLVADSAATLVVQHEERFLSLLLLVDGAPRLLRTKPLARSNGNATAVLREAALTLGFVRESVGIDGEIEVRLSCGQPEMDASLRAWLADQSGLVPTADTAGPPCGPTPVVDRLGSARLAPALAVVSGELR
jgi:hypothetical protein